MNYENKKNILIIKKIRCHFIKLRFSYPDISNLGKLIYYSFLNVETIEDKHNEIN